MWRHAVEPGAVRGEHRAFLAQGQSRTRDRRHRFHWLGLRQAASGGGLPRGSGRPRPRAMRGAGGTAAHQEHWRGLRRLERARSRRRRGEHQREAGRRGHPRQRRGDPLEQQVLRDECGGVAQGARGQLRRRVLPLQGLPAAHGRPRLGSRRQPLELGVEERRCAEAPQRPEARAQPSPSPSPSPYPPPPPPPPPTRAHQPSPSRHPEQASQRAPPTLPPRRPSSASPSASRASSRTKASRSTASRRATSCPR